MKKSLQIRPLQAHQNGWVLLEVTLCLVVIGVILWVIMQQTDAQWHSLSLSEAQIKAEQNRQKAERMTYLLGQLMKWGKLSSVLIIQIVRFVLSRTFINGLRPACRLLHLYWSQPSNGFSYEVNGWDFI